MALQVETKDCTALSDSELTEMADMCAEGPARFDVGLLSKQREAWVLVTTARDGRRLLGFSFCTLERIGGTPCVLIGLASVKRGSRRDAALRAVAADQLRRAWLAFPDEDVVVGTRLVDPSGYAAVIRGLQDVVPRPGHKASGEERAWGRRLARRFGADGRIEDRSFVVKGDGNPPCVFDFEATKPDVDPDVATLFGPLDRSRGDALIVFGWAMAEDLAARAGGGR
jgi:hypothetical protein